jgi:hypothetical protein
MKHIELFDKFVSYLTPGHLEGLILFVGSTLIMTWVQIKFSDEWRAGLKGPNGYWEGPEILLYICFWLFPPMVLADIFLQLKASELVWYIFLACIFFGLTGRWGLEWLLAFKSGANQVTTTTHSEEKTIIKKEEKIE